MKTLWKILILSSGLIFFGWYLLHADLRSVSEMIRRIGWLAPLMLIPYTFVYAADSVGWRLVLPPATKTSFWTFFRIFWAGEAVNSFFPSATVGGEAAKVYMLQKHGVTTSHGASGAVVSKTAQTVGQIIYVLLGSIAFLKLAGDRPGVSAGMIFVLCGCLVVLVGLFWIQRRGVFGSMLAVASILCIKLTTLEKRRAKILEIDSAINGFYSRNRRQFFASTGMYFIGWLLDMTEIYLVAFLLGTPITWTQALAVDAFTSVAKVLGMWIPGSLGVQESGIVMTCRLAGLPPTLAVAYALLRRAREVVFAIIGWAFLWSEEASLKTIQAETTSIANKSSPE